MEAKTSLTPDMQVFHLKSFSTGCSGVANSAISCVEVHPSHTEGSGGGPYLTFASREAAFGGADNVEIGSEICW